MFLVVAEVALLLALVATAVGVLTEMNRSGESLSCRSLGWSNAQRLLVFVVAAFPLLLVGTYVSVLAARHAQEPGRLAQEVLDEGKNACVLGKRTVAIPLLETSWLCSAPPKVAMVYRGTPLVADDAHVDATLSAISLTNVSSSVERDGVGAGRRPADPADRRAVLRRLHSGDGAAGGPIRAGEAADLVVGGDRPVRFPVRFLFGSPVPVRLVSTFCSLS